MHHNGMIKLNLELPQLQILQQDHGLTGLAASCPEKGCVRWPLILFNTCCALNTSCVTQHCRASVCRAQKLIAIGPLD